MGRDRALVRVALVAMTAMILAVTALTVAPGVGANGKGVTVYLGYLPEVSNWGPYEAMGQAYVNAGEGRAHVTVHHMISDPAIRYEVWLVRADDRDTLFSVGTFNVDASGHAEVELHNPTLRPAEFRFLVISAEPAADNDPRPDPRRTVAGVFPNAQARPTGNGAIGFDGIWTRAAAHEAGSEAAGPAGSGGAPGSGAATSSGGSGRAADAPTSPPPPRLPVTGGGPPASLAVALAVARVASLALMAAGVCRQRAAARARHDTANGGER